MSSPPSHPLPADEILVAQLLAGDEAAFTLVVDGWSPGMRRVARTFVTSDASAVEVVQDAWLAVVTSLPGFEGRCRLRTWVYRILVNAARRRASQEGRILPMGSLEGEDAGPVVGAARFQGPEDPYPGHWRAFPDEWPEQALASAELRDVVQEAVARLPHRQRVVITLRDIESCDSAEVCDLLDITPGHQRVLLHRARASVRDEVAAYFEGGGGSDAHRSVP
ncbi:sigma-70 family RNA polymerase sigma factor [Mumia zhuanghuii]|uniref:RNA polymerase sigma factor n=2 Tax=Mumia TaxID=1546255 RepID=A0ABW1QP90_9ACTN|nr:MULTISPECIES: sigma-70 family RNA polymerase sigma factor [Mumia]KAA1423764.1 sigma-70 family RNA polymerase sigma factor [Mumia zhuanghuii]